MDNHQATSTLPTLYSKEEVRTDSRTRPLSVKGRDPELKEHSLYFPTLVYEKLGEVTVGQTESPRTRPQMSLRHTLISHLYPSSKVLLPDVRGRENLLDVRGEGVEVFCFVFWFFGF